MQRLIRVGVQLEPHEFLITGAPWNTTFCVHFTDPLTAPDGEVVYSNRGTILPKIVWGKVTYHEVNEDTQKVAELDEYLALHEASSP